MSAEAVRGLAETYALFGIIPDAAREQLAVELAVLAREGLAAQKAAAPKDTGALSSGLSMQVSLRKLSAQFGLIGRRKGRSKLFYGIIVNFGRKAKVKLNVQRRVRVNGRLRLSKGRKRAEDIKTKYDLPIRARAAVPFIDAPGRDFEQVAAGQLAEFWTQLLARAGD